MRDEEKSFLAESAQRDYNARMWAKIRKFNALRNGVEHSLCAIKGVRSGKAGEKAVWHFPSRKRYFNINRNWPNCWGLES